MKKQKEIKKLNIELKKPMIDTVMEYCKEADYDEAEFGYLFGMLTSSDKEKKKFLVEMCRVFFFAGMFCVKEKKKFKYKFEIEKQNEKQKQSYFG